MRKKKGILITAVLACTVVLGAGGYAPVSYTHLTLPTTIRV